VTSAITIALQHAATTQDIQEYFQEKYLWTAAAIDDMDWIITSCTLKRIYDRAKTTTQKCIHEWLPPNAYPGQANPEAAQACPCCKFIAEKHIHFPSCIHPSMQQAWTIATQTIQQLPTYHNSDPF
jgi:hypothetical protein